MKKIILLLMCLSSLFSKDLIWNSYNDGIMNKENKPILYMLSATYCSYCEKTKELMNNDKNLNEYINNNFIIVSQNRDIEKVPSYLDRQITPTLFVLDKKGKILGTELIGFHTKETLLKFLNLHYYKFKYGN